MTKKVEIIAVLTKKGYKAGDTLTFKQVARFLTRAGAVKDELPQIVENAEKLGMISFEDGSRLRLL